MNLYRRLVNRDEWQFLAMLPKAAPALAILWWFLLITRGVLPALFAVGMGLLVGAVQSGTGIPLALAFVGFLFVAVQTLSPLHLATSQNLGSRMAAYMYDSLSNTCVSPPGIGHLEDPELTKDLAMARDFDLGISGPPLDVSMDFVASGLVEMVAGLTAACILFGYAWWAPLVLGGAWIMTHYLLRDSAIWRDRQTDEVRLAQRHADYAYKMAVDPPASKEVRLFGLSEWVVERFTKERRFLHDLRWHATRLRQKPVIWCLLLVLSANALVFGFMAMDAVAGLIELDRLVMFAAAGMTTSSIAFGGLSWALDSASAPAGAVVRLEPEMAKRGGLKRATTSPTVGDNEDIVFNNVTFAYPRTGEVILKEFNLVIPAGTSMAIVGVNGSGKTTIAKLLCRFYDPQSGSIQIGDVPISEIDIKDWRSRTTAVFQDYMKLELPLRMNVSPDLQADDERILQALENAGARQVADLDTPLNRAYLGGTDLSGGQWQRVALARALCSVYSGAQLVLLDEPTAQLDVRGEAEIFDRLLAETRGTTTVLISHRFSTVRKADQICVLEKGRVVELGSHEELMQQKGRYHTMFDLQASRFEQGEQEEEQLDVV